MYGINLQYKIFYPREEGNNIHKNAANKLAEFKTLPQAKASQAPNKYYYN